MKQIVNFTGFLLLYLVVRLGVAYVPTQFIDIEIIYISIAALVLCYECYFVSTKETNKALNLSTMLLSVAIAIIAARLLIFYEEIIYWLIMFSLASMIFIFLSLLFIYFIREKKKEKKLLSLLAVKAIALGVIVFLVEKFIFY